MRQIVLMYHDVYSSSESESGFQFPTSFPYKTSADKFESHVKYAYNYCKENNLPTDSIEFTFDDGGESFHRVIAPILDKYGFKGIFFISTSYIGAEKFITKEQIKSLYQRGHIIASHSHSHPRNMTLLSEQEILKEWKESKSILEEIIQAPITTASVPSGYCSKSIIEAAKESGIKTLYTSKPTNRSLFSGDITIIGRYVVHCNTTLNIVIKIISNKWYRGWLLARWGILNLAKKILGANYNKIKKRILR